MVSCDVVRDQPEERCQRVGLAAGTRIWKLRDSMDLAPQAASGDGSARSGSSFRERRSRRDLCRRSGGGNEGAPDGTKAIVVVAAEKDGNGIGRIRIRRVMDVSGDSLIPFVKDAVTPGSVVHTDGWSGYSGLVQAGYQHQVTVISHSKELAHELMPRVHIVASLLKRWLAGTHQGGVQNHQLDYYLDEFTFRFNRRHSKARGLLFHRLVQQAVAVGPAPYRTLIGTESQGHRLGQ
jgi:transposase-like protein